jgi:hypothetical protein
VGVRVGLPDGAVVGCAVGARVGKEVGAAVGANVGSAVGVAVGECVGTALGANVGKYVGEDVGAAVEGAMVGAAVGAALGGLVPKQLAHDAETVGQPKNCVTQTPHTAKLVTEIRALTSVMLQSSMFPLIGVRADAVKSLDRTTKLPKGAYSDW